MTPMELRKKALSRIESAAVLSDANNYDEASYNVGYAVEFALKARYCTRQGWTDFPNDRMEARRRGAPDVITHDLDRLVRLTDHESLKLISMQHIDWKRAMDWSEQQRYDPVGTITREQVQAQIAETLKLWMELALYEIVEKLQRVEIECSQVFDGFNFFALALRATQTQGWEVLMSARWLSDGGRAKVEEIRDRISAVLDQDVFNIIRASGRNEVEWHDLCTLNCINGVLQRRLLS